MPWPPLLAGAGVRATLIILDDHDIAWDLDLIRPGGVTVAGAKAEGGGRTQRPSSHIRTWRTTGTAVHAPVVPPSFTPFVLSVCLLFLIAVSRKRPCSNSQSFSYTFNDDFIVRHRARRICLVVPFLFRAQAHSLPSPRPRSFLGSENLTYRQNVQAFHWRPCMAHHRGDSALQVRGVRRRRRSRRRQGP
ncbi:hypothetical protein BN1708_000742 [Verticillium longisporum]|uniref:Uncharacterized protein n=1 Tax=Verticillium longisporum TaxID=100787 RepID=A0A0G4LY79_VERLO|nr:hypothetical protein BN1708_000742 [Verticillium longisporum]